jgi:hypothetical protein
MLCYNTQKPAIELGFSQSNIQIASSFLPRIPLVKNFSLTHSAKNNFQLIHMQPTVNFTNSKNIRLSGMLHLPDTKEVQAYALYAHCFTCTKSIKAAITIPNKLAQQGFATLRFDSTCLGGSKGAFADRNFSTN